MPALGSRSLTSRLYFDKPLPSFFIAEIAVPTTIPQNTNANRPDRATRLVDNRRRVIKTLAHNWKTPSGQAN